tara:strand:+ start:134 stop:1012 length:879 start_codon:yes stop_codon:yes gene_type:complete
MKNNEIRKKLNLLGIFNEIQLEDTDTNIEYWWLIKYKELHMKKDCEGLYEINDIRDELQTYSVDKLKKFLSKEKVSINNSSNDYEKERKKGGAYNFNKEELKERLIKNENKEFIKKKLEEAKGLFLLKKYSNAQKLFTNLIESSEFKFLENSKKFYLHFSRGISFLELKQFDKALNDLTSAIKIDSKSSIAYFNRGLCNLRKENWSNAIIDFTEAIVLKDFYDGKYYYLRGCAKNGLKKYEDALEDFKIAIAMDPLNDSFKRTRKFTEKILKRKSENMYYKNYVNNLNLNNV